MPATDELMASYSQSNGQRTAQPLRRGTAAHVPSSAGLQPPSSKQHRAHSAPSVPKVHGTAAHDNHHDAEGHDDEDDDEDDDDSQDDTPGTRPTAPGNAGDSDEITGDNFFHRYNLSQPPTTDKKMRTDGDSSAQSSSDDTEGPVSPTQVRTKARLSGMSAPSDSIAPPRSPVTSIAVRLALCSALLLPPTLPYSTLSSYLNPHMKAYS